MSDERLRTSQRDLLHINELKAWWNELNGSHLDTPGLTLQRTISGLDRGQTRVLNTSIPKSLAGEAVYPPAAPEAQGVGEVTSDLPTLWSGEGIVNEIGKYGKKLAAQTLLGIGAGVGGFKVGADYVKKHSPVLVGRKGFSRRELLAGAGTGAAATVITEALVACSSFSPESTKFEYPDTPDYQRTLLANHSLSEDVSGEDLSRAPHAQELVSALRQVVTELKSDVSLYRTNIAYANVVSVHTGKSYEYAMVKINDQLDGVLVNGKPMLLKESVYEMAYMENGKAVTRVVVASEIPDQAGGAKAFGIHLADNQRLSTSTDQVLPDFSQPMFETIQFPNNNYIRVGFFDFQTHKLSEIAQYNTNIQQANIIDLFNSLFNPFAYKTAEAAALVPTATPTAPIKPTVIATATARVTLEPTRAASPTQTPFPTYPEQDVKIAGVQRIENKPEWKSAAQNAINQYAKTYNIEASKVKLTIKGFKDKSGNPFALAITSETGNADADGKLLMIWSQDQKSGEWGWSEATLKKLGEKRGMLMGAFFGGSNTTSTDFDNIAKVVRKEFELGGVYIGMSSIHPSKNTFNLDYLKWQIKPENNRMSTLLVHPLIWGNDAPNWIRSMDRDKAIEALKGHVQMIMSVLKQQKMDSPPVVVVVNEAYVDQDVLNKIIGPDYVDIAFKTAREAMPEAILIYNDFDNDTPDAPRYKTTQTIINRLISQGLIDGVGIQGRRSKGVDKSQLIIGLKGYGIPVYITEYGFDIRDVPGDDVQRFSFQAKEYQTETEGAIESGVVKAFIDFQLGDRFSAWEDPAFIYSSPKADQTPYNDNLEPKPALYAQRAAFITAKTP